MSVISNVESQKINQHIGKRIKLARISLGMTQERLSAYLGITFQQVQKYENGKNRVSAGSLLLISKFLNIDISYFFEGFRDTCNENHNDKSCIYIDANDKHLHGFMKIYSHHGNLKSKKLILETSRLILKFFREKRS